MCSERRCETAAVGLSQQSDEAEGSLIREVPERVASSPDNDGTRRNYRTARARQARRECVTKVNQWLNPRKCGTGSNPVDMGWAAVRAEPIDGEATSATVLYAVGGGHGEGLRRTRGKAVGEELGAAPVDRHMVNMGTTPAPPVRPRSQRGSGQAHRRLMGPEWGGAAVVLRDRESRSHGEGRQRVRSSRTDMPGGRW
jgi:hypothetical protein